MPFRTKTKGIKPSFTVELLEINKEHAFERLRSYPSVYQHGTYFLKETGKLYELDGYIFLYATGQWILDNLKPGESQGLYEFAEWACRNYPERRGSSWDKPGDRARKQHMHWCRHPDKSRGTSGIWTVKDFGVTLLTVNMEKGGLEHEATLTKGFGRDVFYNTNHTYINTPSRQTQIEVEFPVAWKKARDAYRKANKDLAKAEAAAVEEARQERAEEAKADVLEHLDRLIKNLQDYKTIVSERPEEITVSRVREIFDDTNQMTSLNAELKAALGIK